MSGFSYFKFLCICFIKETEKMIQQFEDIMMTCICSNTDSNLVWNVNNILVKWVHLSLEQHGDISRLSAFTF